MSLITFTRTVNGALADATSVVLQDPTGAFGIQRNDTGAAAVAAGASVVHASTGTYTYDTSGLSPNLAYTAYWMVTSPWGVDYVQELISPYGLTAQSVMLEAVAILEGTGPSGFLAGAATAGSSQAALEDTVQLKSSIVQNDLYQDRWIWRPTAVNAADQIRVCKMYDPDNGLLYPDATYIVAPANGEVYAVFSIVSPKDMLAALNRLLRRMYFETELQLAPSTDPLQRRYNLTAVWPWLKEKWQVRQMGFLSTGLQRQDYNPYDLPIRGRAFKEDNVLYVEIPAGYVNSGTFYIKAVRQFFSQVNGTYSTTGVTTPSDVIDPDLDWVTHGLLTHCYALLLRNTTKDEHDELMEQAIAQAGLFSSYTRQHFRMPKNTFDQSELLVSNPAATDESGLLYRAG